MSRFDQEWAVVPTVARWLAVLASLAVAVLFMGIYPLPFTDVMHAAVNELLRHVALSKS